eukprot:GHRR01034448.1.p1 GENE.GHRR01034448.1~~GHRR01034448.1.p1  ORF type:complete len:154 (+),score=32.28 GHRR01034448.1:247-708(+)
MHCLLSAIIQLTWCCDYCQRGINAAMRYSEPSSDSNALLYAQKHRLNSHCDVVLQSNAELPAWAVLSSAGLGGIAYWLVIFPVDVIKSSMQTDSIIKSKRRFPNMSTAAKLLWAEGGVKRFYKGFTPCLIRAAPANGAMLFTVDKVTNWLNRE